jgi:excisionase family DNA binding protein
MVQSGPDKSRLKELEMTLQDSQEILNRRGWMTVKRAAAYLGKPPSWIYDNVHRLEIPHVRLERQYRFRTSDLDAWLESRMQYATPRTNDDAA